MGEQGGRGPDGLAKTAVSQGPARTDPVRGLLTVTGGDEVGRVIPIGDDPVSLGRADECTVRFEDASLSRVHARVVRLGNAYVLKDMGSTNGSFVNDARVDFASQLEDGDRIRLGSATGLRFSLASAAEEAALTRMYEASKRDSLAEQLATADDEAGLKDDLLSAREFQQRALPEPPSLPGSAIDLVYRPLELVGGDLHHLSALDEKTLRVFLADATGHGIKASLTTMLILSEYEIVKRDAAGPAAVLAALNDRLATTYAHLAVRFTAACLDFDLARGRLRHASAAHPAPWLLRDGEPRELESGGTFVGLLAGTTYPEWSVDLEAGDGVLTFTDGATEAFGGGGEPFGELRLSRAAARAASHGRAPGAAALEALERFVGAGSGLGDDVTIVSVRWLGAPRP